METDEHEEIFYEEGVMWYNDFSQVTDLAAFRQTWRHNTSWLDLICPMEQPATAQG